MNLELRSGSNHPETLGAEIDWNAVSLALWEDVRFANVLLALEWIAFVRPAFVGEFLARMSRVGLWRRYGALVPAERTRLANLIQNPQLREAIRQWERTIQHRKWTDARASISSVVREGAVITVDLGAARVLHGRSRSLLPIGVVGVEGEFDDGDGVLVQSVDGSTVGVGLVEYSSQEVREIMGRHSGVILELLGRFAGSAVIRRSAFVRAADLSVDRR